MHLKFRSGMIGTVTFKNELLMMNDLVLCNFSAIRSELLLYITQNSSRGTCFVTY